MTTTIYAQLSTYLGAEDVVRRRGYCDQFVTMHVCVCLWAGMGVCVCVHVSTIKRKPMFGMTLNLA